MADDNNEGTAPFAEDLKSALHEMGTYALPLTIRANRHRRQSHAGDAASSRFDNDRRKQNVTHDIVILCDQ